MGQSCCSSENAEADDTNTTDRRVEIDSDDSDYSTDSNTLNTEDQYLEKTPEPTHSPQAQARAKKGFIEAVKNGNDSLAMHFVQEYSELDLLNLVFEVDKKEKVEDGDICLHVAVRNKHYRLIYYLLDSGVSGNIQNRFSGDTALHTAVRTREIKTVTLLFKYKADQNITNKARETPLSIASDNKDEDILELLAPDTQKLLHKVSSGKLDINADADDVLAGLMIDDNETADNKDNKEQVITRPDSEQLIDKLDEDEKLKMEAMRVARTNPFSKLQRTNTKKALKEMQDIAAAKDGLPELAAWLEKKQNTMPYQWQKRWVVIKGSYMLWSDIQRNIKDSKNIKERKKFNNSLNIMSITEVKPVKKGKTQRKWIITVGAGKKKREYLWRCATQNDRDFWVLGVQKHIAHMKSVIVYLGTK